MQTLLAAEHISQRDVGQMVVCRVGVSGNNNRISFCSPPNVLFCFSQIDFISSPLGCCSPSAVPLKLRACQDGLLVVLSPFLPCICSRTGCFLCLSHSISLSLSLPLSHPVCLSISLSLSLSRSLALSLSLSLSRCPSADRDTPV